MVSFYHFVSQANLHAGIPVAALPLVASAGMLCKFSLNHTHTNRSPDTYLDLLPDMKMTEATQVVVHPVRDTHGMTGPHVGDREGHNFFQTSDKKNGKRGGKTRGKKKGT